MKRVIILALCFLGIQLTSHSQIVGNRLQIGSFYTFESESGPGLFISYGTAVGRASLNAANKTFKVVAPLNGKAGFVSLKAADLPGENYLAMAEVCPTPYTQSNYYNITTLIPTDSTFNENASFEVLSGRSNANNAELVSFRVKNGTHFFKREQGVFMNAPGGAAPEYMNHFTFKIKPIKIVADRLRIGGIYTFESESGAGLFISYGAATGRATLNAANKKFKVVEPLNGKAGFVSLQAIDLSGVNYLVMAEACPKPYTQSNYYNVSTQTPNDQTFNENASFEVLAGRSNGTNVGLVSFRVKNGTHFFKREQGVFMNAPGGAAPQYMNHFTFKLTEK